MNELRVLKIEIIKPRRPITPLMDRIVVLECQVEDLESRAVLSHRDQKRLKSSVKRLAACRNELLCAQ
ncbi:MAG: hypothetical protein G01um101466_853 [Parcubacteria group bacterium Gr01-1014_66]|nr:MAG: hypothetical protein G01um101466_853 [Parcubacteria group bacterium Gr01-1014_66]